MSEKDKQVKEAAKRKVAIRGTIKFMSVFLNIMLLIGFLSSFAELRKKREQIVHYKKQVEACKKQAKAEGSKHWVVALQLGVCKKNKWHAQDDLVKCMKIITAAHTQMPLNFEEAKRAIMILRKDNKVLKVQVANSVPRRRYGGYSAGQR